MGRRTWNELIGNCGCLNPRGRWNLILNTVVAISFIITAISGVYFLFVTGGRWTADTTILFTHNTWDLIHTWAGVSLIAAVVIHLAIHWKWVTKVTRKMFGIKLPAPSVPQPSVTR